MISKYKRQDINKALKELVEDYNGTFKMTTARSREEYIKAAKPGSILVAPKTGTFYSETDRKVFQDRCVELRTKARDILNDTVKELKSKTTEAPSAEAVNAITLLAMRKNITESEIGDLLDRYGDNPQAHKTLVSIAVEHDIRSFDDHPVYAELQNVNDLARTLDNNISLQSAERGHAGDGFCSILDGMIDTAFPTE